MTGGRVASATGGAKIESVTVITVPKKLARSQLQTGKRLTQCSLEECSLVLHVCIEDAVFMSGDVIHRSYMLLMGLTPRDQRYGTPNDCTVYG